MAIRRMKTETPAARAAKIAYCALGSKRSLQRLAKEAGYSYHTLNRWSLCHGWQDFASAFDAKEEDRLTEMLAERIAEGRVDELEQQRNIARILVRKGLQVLEAVPAGDSRLSEAVSAVRLGVELLSASTRDGEMRQQAQSGVVDAFLEALATNGGEPPDRS